MDTHAPAPLYPSALGTRVEGRAGGEGLVLRAARAFGVPLAVWTGLAALNAVQMYWAYQQKDPNVTVRFVALSAAGNWLFWAPATPLIFWAGLHLAGRRAAAVAGHVLLGVALVAAHAVWTLYAHLWAGQPYVLEGGGVWARFPMAFGKGLFWDGLVYGGILTAFHALQSQRRVREVEVAHAQLQSRLVQAQLDALKAQLHPHFLFNTLNAISFMVRKGDIPGSVRMLAGVSELLRLALHNTGRHWVSLREELDFAERYLAIEQTRFADRLTVAWRVAPEVLGARVPNLLLQPLVENAVKHGVAPREAPGRIEVVAERVGEVLRLEVCDDGPGLDESKAARCGDSNGIGLANVRARLEQLYGGAGRLRLEPGACGGVCARVEVPWQAHGEEAAP